MALAPKKVSSADSLATISNVLVSAFVIATLYFGRDLLVPLALAALLTFMTAPLATKLQRYLGRVGAVLVIVITICAAAAGAGWTLTRQAVDLANQLPNYKENIRTKLKSIELPSNGPFDKISQTLEELKKDLPGANDPKSPLKLSPQVKTEKEPMPVEVVSGRDERLEFAQVILAPVLGPLGTASLVLLLLVFMLLQREDLRNRLIRLVGQGRISATTRAMDDAGNRVSKYLLMQLVVNVTYGIPVAIGLYFIGVPNAILWGALATVLRFVPYVGPWIAAAFPIILSLAVSPNWTAPLLTISLFVVLELISNNVMEPWLYGSSTGVTPIALIVAALVWTWLWGPVGLVLATPLTVCLVVMGRHIPKLAFLSILLSDEEPLTPAEDCYHRLHRSGEHDEMEFVDTFLKSNHPAALFDSVLIPVISASEADYRLGLLEKDQLDFIQGGINEILSEMEIRLDAQPAAAQNVSTQICCLPAKARRDQLAGEMLSLILQAQGHQAVNASARLTSGEMLGWVREQEANIVCISVVNPSTTVQARYLCSKLKANNPSLKVIVGLWGSSPKAVESIKTLRESGADDVVMTTAEAAARVAHYAPIPKPIVEDVS